MRKLATIIAGAAFATLVGAAPAGAGGVKIGFGYGSGSYYGGHGYYRRRSPGHGLVYGLNRLFGHGYYRKRNYGYGPSYSGNRYPSYNRGYSRNYDNRSHNYGSGYSGNSYQGQKYKSGRKLGSYDAPGGSGYQGTKRGYGGGGVLGGPAISQKLYNYGYRRVLSIRYHGGPYTGHGYRYRRGVYVARAINPYGQKFLVYVDAYSGQHLRRYPLGGRTYTY